MRPYVKTPMSIYATKKIKLKSNIMYKTSIVKILKNLSKTELRELGKFVQSPYFNSRPEVVQLYDALTQALDSPPSVYEKEKLFARIAPTSRTYDDAQMRQWIHQLLKVIKAYFVQKEIEENKTEHQLLLAKAFRKRGMDDFFEKEIENTELSNVEQPYRHADFYFMNYQINCEKIEYASLTRRKGDMPFEGLMQSLSTFFATEMLRLNSVSLSYQTVSQRLVDAPMLTEVLNWVEKSGVLKIREPLVNTGIEEKNQNISGGVLKMYYHAFQALKTNNALNFNELKQLLNEHWQELPEKECRTIYLATFNFCTKKINNAEWEYLEHFFDLIESGLKNKSLFENGIISKFTYKNAVSVAIRLKKYEWVRQFLSDYKSFLHTKDRETTYSYNLAVYYMSLNEFEKAQTLLQYSDFGDLQTNLAGRALLVRIYYETNALDALDSLLDSFQVFIQRQKDIGYYKDNYLNLIKVIRQILKTDLKDLAKRKELRTQVQATPNIALKDWLLEKLA
jgi:hypothetical protein